MPPEKTETAPPEEGPAAHALSVEEPAALDFDAAPSVVVRQDSDSPPPGPMPEATAHALSVGLLLAAILGCFWAARRLSRGPVRKPSLGPSTAHEPLDALLASVRSNPASHVLSLAVASFLGLNLFFGGLTVFLVGRTPEDARSYFTEISPLKLARLSHEHSFGYGLLFGAMGTLALAFLGTRRIGVLFPLCLGFAFCALDVASWWLNRYVSYGFHWLSVSTGAVFSISFLVLYGRLAATNIRGFLASARRE